MRQLPFDGHGYPVPWFVAWTRGALGFRAVSAEMLVRAQAHAVPESQPEDGPLRRLIHRTHLRDQPGRRRTVAAPGLR